MSRWIKATTPPDSQRDVLALEEDGVPVIAVCMKKGDWRDPRTWSPITVHHWMPIPRRPKGYEDENA